MLGTLIRYRYISAGAQEDALQVHTHLDAGHTRQVQVFSSGSSRGCCSGSYTSGCWAHTSGTETVDAAVQDHTHLDA